MDHSLWQTIAFMIMLFFFLMFSLLDGFDLGTGMLLPFARSQSDRQRLIGLIAPVVEGNKVWIVIGVAFFFAAFPQAFGILLSSFYLPVILAVLLFAIRVVAIEFSQHDTKHLDRWHRTIAVTSFGFTFASLYSLALVTEGLPLLPSGAASANPIDYLSGFSAFFALAGTLAVQWHGIVYSESKLDQSPLSHLSKPVWIALIAVIALLVPLYLIIHPFGKIADWGLLSIGFITFAGGQVAGGFLRSKRGTPFICSCVSVLGLWMCIGSILKPDLVRSRIDPQFHLNLMQLSTPSHSLKMIVISALLITPFILVYTALLYKVFKKR